MAISISAAKADSETPQVNLHILSKDDVSSLLLMGNEGLILHGVRMEHFWL